MARNETTESLVSINPATGEEIWSGPVGDPAAEVAAARDALGPWAAHSLAFRSEAVRRFANVVRKREEEFAKLISSETGKPFWEAKTEVNSVIAKVEISISAYSERTPTSRLEAALGNKVTVRWIYRKLRDGKPWHLRGIDVFTVRDGKIAAKLSYVKG